MVKMNCAAMHRTVVACSDGEVRFLATAIPGVGPILATELAEVAGATVGAIENDGRNDVVPFALERAIEWSRLRTAEDIYAELRVFESRGSGNRDGPSRKRGGALGTALGPLVRELVDERALADALDILGTRWRTGVGTTFRVIARVTDESRFRRTALRDEVSGAIAELRPRWRVDDPADVEVWVIQTGPHRFRSAVRITDATMRHRGGRVEERSGALRPTVAAAMVRLVGPPAGSRVLLDPCCGSGTIVAEARDAGWRARGTDIDTAALAIARANYTNATFEEADLLALDVASGSIDAVVTNLPFGQQFGRGADATAWLTGALAELARAISPRGSVVLLHPDDAPWRAASGALATLVIDARYPVNLLGAATTIWALGPRP